MFVYAVVFTLGLALMALVQNVVNILLVVFGIGFLIFIHELGHFLVAKWEGVRVEAFALGFGRALYCKKHGDTEYRLNLLPLGGYVKMAGEMPGEGATGAPDEYTAKRPAQRARILVAGVLMNALFGLLMAIIAFGIGVRFEVSAIGTVIPGEPAWVAGLQTGDRISALNGQEMSSFTELATCIAFADLEKGVQLTVERGNQTFQQTVKPVYNLERGFPTVGIGPLLSTRLRIAEGSRAYQAGLRTEDVILEIDGHKVSNGHEIYGHFPPDERPVPLLVQRGQETVKVELTPEMNSVYKIGVRSRRLVALSLRDNSSAHQLGLQKGDLIIAVNDVPILTWEELVEKIKEIAGRTFALRVRRQEKEVVLTGAIPWLTVAGLTQDSPGHELGLKPGDLILAIGEVAVSSLEEWQTQLRTATGNVSWRVRREGKEVVLSGLAQDPQRWLSSLQFDGLSPFFASIYFENDLHLGMVEKNFPAGLAGLQTGDQLLSIDDRPLKTWGDLQEVVSNCQGKELAITYRRGEKIQTVKITPQETKEPAIGALAILPELTAPRRYGVIEACQHGFRHSVNMAMHVLLTIKSLFKRQVSTQNLGGPITIFYATYSYLQLGIGRFLHFLALISINLAILNILPLPLLDGFQLMMVGVEKIKGSPVSEKLLIVVNYIGIVLILSLFLYVTFNDITRLIFGY